MNVSTKELHTMLANNPELALVGDGWDIGRNPTIAGASPRMTEHQLQTLVIEECDRRALANPAYALLYAIPNGQYRPGQRMEAGVKAGIPDLHLPIARHSRHSLYIELKISPRQQTPDQLKWQRRLRVEGHMCECIWDDVEKVMSLLEWYIER